MLQFELFLAGVAAGTQQWMTTQESFAIRGIDFNDAIRRFVATLPMFQRMFWNFDEETKIWSRWGMKAYPTYSEAVSANPIYSPQVTT